MLGGTIWDVSGVESGLVVVSKHPTYFIISLALIPRFWRQHLWGVTRVEGGAEAQELPPGRAVPSAHTSPESPRYHHYLPNLGLAREKANSHLVGNLLLQKCKHPKQLVWQHLISCSHCAAKAGNEWQMEGGSSASLERNQWWWPWWLDSPTNQGAAF